MIRSRNALPLLKVLIAAAWADSRLSQAELNYIKELARRFDLDDPEWFELQPFIEDPVKEEEQEALLRELLGQIGSSSERNAIIQHLEEIVETNTRITLDEKDLLERYKNILNEPSSMDLMLGKLKKLFQSPPKHSTLDIDEFLRNKILFKLRRRVNDGQITPDMHRMALLGGLMGIVAQADHEIHERELEEIRRQLSALGGFDDDAMNLLLAVIQEESVRGLDRYRLITEYTADFTLEERTDLLNLLFAIAAADGALTHPELEELRAISSALHLSHRQYIDAKVRCGS